METRIRVFNEKGITNFATFLENVRFNGLTTSFPREMLIDPAHTSTLTTDNFITQKAFENKYNAAKYLADVLKINSHKEYYYNTGLWTWLSAFYFDQVCPLEKGTRKPGQDARHILQDPKDFRTYYRHLLAGPVRIYAELGESGRIFLAGELSKRGDLVEQLQAYQNIALNRGIIESADLLYWDAEHNKLKKGAGSKGAGSPRRFVNIISQFELTYDLNSLSGKEIVELFPAEFKKWLN